MGSLRTVIRGGTVYDGTDAAPAVADVVVADGRIVDIGPGLDGDEALDVAGRGVLPGLFDCHTHVLISNLDFWRLVETPLSYRFYRAAGNLRATLHTGVTSVRDAGGADLGVKRAVEEGLLEGPRMQIAVTMLSQTGGHADTWAPSGQCVATLFPEHAGVPASVVDGPDEMRRRVRELVRAGADVVKVATSGGVLSTRDDPRHAHFRDDELAVLGVETRAAGIPFMAHAHAADGVKAAVRAGARSVEHGIYMDDEAIELMASAGTWLVPTLSAPLAAWDAVEAGTTLPANVVSQLKEAIADHEGAFRAALDAGVRVAMGTDAGVGPHGVNLRELELMVRYGMKPADALASATREAAALLGVDDRLGTLEPGKVADLVVVDGDPMDVAGLGERVVTVFKDGRRVVG